MLRVLVFRANVALLWNSGDVGFALATLGITFVVPLWRLWAMRRSVQPAPLPCPMHATLVFVSCLTCTAHTLRYTAGQLASSLLHADVLIDTINTARSFGGDLRADEISILHVEHGRRPSLATTQTAKSLLQSIPMAMLQVQPPCC